MPLSIITICQPQHSPIQQIIKQIELVRLSQFGSLSRDALACGEGWAEGEKLMFTVQSNQVI
jgi:hypothetical protein